MNADTPATPAKPRIREVLTQPRMLAILLLGAASGLPNPLSESIMQAWLHRPRDQQYEDRLADVRRTAISAQAAVGAAARPLHVAVARTPAWLDAFIQLLLAAAIGSLAMFGGAHQLTAIALVLLVVVFLSASQDMVIDAYRTDVARPRGTRARGRGRATSVIARFRTESLAVALIVADNASWRAAFLTLAVGDGIDDDRDYVGARARRSARQDVADARRLGARFRCASCSACPA